MNQSKSSGKDIVFFLGAGFSKEAEMPLMAEFGKFSVEEEKNLLERHDFPRNDPNSRRACHRLLDAAEKFKLVQNYFSSIKKFMHFNSNNMEDVFSALDMIRSGQFNEKIRLENSEYDLDQLVRDVQIWLWKIYQRCTPVNREDMRSRYKGFFDIIKNKSLQRRLSVITTNYDLIFEYLAFKNGLFTCYPKVLQIEELKITKDGGKFMNDSQKDNIPIYKLHGSINLFLKDRKKNLKTGVESLDDSEEEEEGDDTIYASFELGDGKTDIGNTRKWGMDRPVIFALDAIWAIWNKYGELLSPAIIPPTYTKIRSAHWLKTFWNGAYKSITNARKIVFVGYSFPESDGFMKSFLHAAFANRNSDDPLEIMVVNPEKNDLDRYEKLFPECKRVEKGFCDSYNDIEDFISK